MTIYFETARHGLIPCRFLGYAKTPAHDVTRLYNVVVKLRGTPPAGCGYQKGDVLHVGARWIVEKAGQRDYRQMVKAVTLPERTEENTREARE